MPDQIAASTDAVPTRYQCRHIFTDGHRCGSPCLRSEDFCYYHHTTRGSAEHLRDGDNRSDTFELPVPEDRSAIQTAIAQVLQRLAASAIDTKRAGLLLYGLQIASANLPKDQHAQRDNHPHEAIVEEIDLHPELGLLAPQTAAPPPDRTTREQNLDWREREIKRREYELNARETLIARAERCQPVSPTAPIVDEPWNLKATQPAILPEIKAVADTTAHNNLFDSTCQRENLRLSLLSFPKGICVTTTLHIFRNRSTRTAAPQSDPASPPGLPESSH